MSDENDGKAILRRVFGVDLRSVAAFRIGLGLLILADLAGRAPFLEAHYGGGGLMPLAAVTHPTIYALSGSPVLAGALFAVAGVFAVMLALGYRTFLATAASWFLLVSLHLRNPLVINSGDKLLALLLFWSLFLPLGARASVDARRAPARERPPDTILTVASLALLLQLVCLYVFSALLKSKLLWVEEGTAMHYALEVDTITKGFGRWLLSFPELLVPLTRATFVLELLGPLAIFVPVASARVRLVTVAVFVALHLAMAATFMLVLFPWVCITAWVAVLPGAFWEALGRRRIARAASRGAVAVVDRLPLSPASSFHLHGRGVDVLVAALLAFVLYWNLTTTSASLGMPRPLQWIGEELGLRQRWAMFGKPPTDDGWWVVPARLADGGEVDLFTGRSPVDREKPARVHATFETGRLRKWLRHARSGEGGASLAAYAAWLRREWDSGRDASRRVVSLEVHWMLEETLPDFTTAPVEDRLLYAWPEPDGPAGD